MGQRAIRSLISRHSYHAAEQIVKNKKPDFSVVLFRSDFVLLSEKNHMKVLTNQWFLARL